MQKPFVAVLGLIATAAISQAAITFTLNGGAIPNTPLMTGNGDVAVNQGTTSKVDFTFTPAASPVFSGNLSGGSGVTPTSGTTWSNTVFTLQTDTDGWPPNTNSYAIIDLGALKLNAGESGNSCSTTTCGITASLSIKVGSTTYTITTPNSFVINESGNNVTVRPDGTSHSGDPEKTPAQFYINTGSPATSGTLNIWLYTSKSTTSWDDFTLSAGGASQEVWMKVWLTPTPEPGSMVLMGGGLLALGLIARRMRQKQSESQVN